MSSCLLLPTSTCTSCHHISFSSDTNFSSQFPKHILLRRRYQLPSLSLSSSRSIAVRAFGNNKKTNQLEEQQDEEVEEDMPWIQEKALDFVEFTGTVTQAIPGPRVGQSSLPWIMAVPLAYFGITFAFAFVKTLRNFNSPKAKRRKLVRHPPPLPFHFLAVAANFTITMTIPHYFCYFCFILHC